MVDQEERHNRQRFSWTTQNFKLKLPAFYYYLKKNKLHNIF